MYSRDYSVLDTQVGESQSSLDTFKVLIFLLEGAEFSFLQLVDKWQPSKIKLKLRLKLGFFFKNMRLLDLYLYRRPIWLSASASARRNPGRCPHFLSFFFFPSHLSCANLRVMSEEAYFRENMYSSISSAERFSIEGCILCLPACRGGAPRRVLGPQLFVFLIGFFCEEQKSGRTHADVVCNQSRKQASEFILGDAHGDSCVTLWSLSFISSVPQIDTRQERRRNRIRHTIIQVGFIWET